MVKYKIGKLGDHLCFTIYLARTKAQFYTKSLCQEKMNPKAGVEEDGHGGEDDEWPLVHLWGNLVKEGNNDQVLMMRSKIV